MFDPLAVMCLEIWGHSTINRYQPSLQGLLRFTGGPAWHCDDPNSSRSLALGEPHKQRCFGNWQDTSTVPERCSVSQSIHSCFRHADVKHSEFCAWICPSSSKLWALGFCWPWRKRAIDFRFQAEGGRILCTGSYDSYESCCRGVSFQSTALTHEEAIGNRERCCKLLQVASVMISHDIALWPRQNKSTLASCSSVFWKQVISPGRQRNFANFTD